MRIYYWKQAVGMARLIEKYRNHIQLILDGNYKEVALEKLHGVNLNGFPVYSTRLNQADRLLFTTIKVHGKNCLLVLDEVLEHEYHDSKFLEKSKLKYFLTANTAAIAQALFEKTEDKPSFAPTQHKEPVASEVYNKQFIVLNTQQEEALKAKLPLLVSGTAGSGKSCVAMLLLAQLAQKPIPENTEILYISSSPELVNTMRRMGSDPRIVFKTYEQLLRETIPEECTGKEFVGKESFMAWYKDHLTANKSRSKAKRQKESALSLKKAEEVYQEFRIICACTEEEYLGLGENQSLFSDKESRASLWHAYQIYEQVLKDKKQIDVGFKKIPDKNKFAAIVVDEAQDFSNLQLDQISNLAINNQVCYCMDTNQRSEDILSTRSALLRKQKLTHVELPYTFRCAPKIATVATEILKLKTHLTGGTADKFEKAAMSTDPELSANYGIIEWIDAAKTTAQEEKDLVNLAQSTQVAIVVSSVSDIQKAKDKFNTELVFTPETIKGLEYPTIIVCGLFDDEVFKEANKELGTETLQSNPNRVRVDANVVKYALPFNRVFTAVTRAQQRLIVYQADTKIENVVRALKTVFTPNLETAPAAPVPSSQAEWLAEANRLEAEGKIAMAQQIRKRYAPKEEAAPAHLPSAPPTATPVANTRVSKNKKKAHAESAPEIKKFDTSRLNLDDLFNRKDYMHQLFCVPCDNFKNLFEKLINSTQALRDHLQASLASKPNILKSLFNAKTLSQPFTVEDNSKWWLIASLVTSQGGLAFFKFLLEQKKLNLSKEITPEILAMNVNLEKHNNMSVLLYLTGPHIGVDILSQIITANQQLAASFPVATYFNLVTDNKDEISGLSPFINLLCNGRIRNLAPLLHEANPVLTILPKAYYEERFIKTIITSLLNDYQLFLILLLYTRVQDFVHAIPEHLLLETDPKLKESPFHAICTRYTAKVPAFVARFVLANPELGKKLALTTIDIGGQERKADLVQGILKTNLQINPNQLPNGVQPLVRAVMQGAEDILIVLLNDQRIDPNLYTPYGATPLYVATALGKENIASVLIASKANVNLPGPNKTTPLMVAADKNNTILVNRLLSAGADPNLRNEKNEDAFSIAFRNANPEIILLLMLSNKLDSNYKLTTTITQCHKVASAAGQQGIMEEFIKARKAENSESLTLSLTDIEILVGHSGVRGLTPHIEDILKTIKLEDAMKSGLTLMPMPSNPASATSKNRDVPKP